MDILYKLSNYAQMLDKMRRRVTMELVFQNLMRVLSGFQCGQCD